jgi:hypothetical protein
MISDTVHRRTLNSHDSLPLDTAEYQGGNSDWMETKSNELWDEAWYHTSQIFYWKWKDTWKEQPSYHGWLTNWSKDFVDNPPSPPKVPNFIQYYHFEKPIELNNKNYVGWRDGDLWLDVGKRGNIDSHPTKKGKRFRDD